MLHSNTADERTKKFIQQTLNFESNMYKLYFKHCCICHQRRLNMKTSNGICYRCQNKKNEMFYSYENKLLPTWKTKNDIIKYTLPSELQHLTLAEKLLIQRVSPLVPVIHIKNGILGIRGHVVSFFQDISGICTELPRLPTDITMIKVVRTGVTADGENIQNVFTVNRSRILNALKWLKQYNPLYKDIIVNESNLNWMTKCQSDTINHVIRIENSNDIDEDKDEGPSYRQVLQPQDELLHPENEYFGCISEDKTQIIFDGDRELTRLINKKIQDRNIQKLHWPPRDIKPISEFSDTKIFCLAFPWLFPGGIGDIKESRECDIDIADWAQNLLFYEDGRFAKDNLWCFFVLNYIQRHRNKSQSRWFVSDFVGDSPPNLETLQTKLLSGDQSFIDKLMYFGKVVPGSNAYWRSKKAELYSWINHHIEKGRGPPNIFMTLSCAEYFWPDLKRLLEHYIYITEGTKVDLDVNLHKLHQALNDYTIIVQEFFQIRVDEFLKTIGLEVFGIKHYWGRFEFAKSRGQIHLHLIGITNDATMINEKLWKLRNNKKQKTAFIANWVRSKFNCTAEIPKNCTTPDKFSSPCKTRFSQTSNIETDQQDLCMFCQIHNCSDYCLKSSTDNSTKNKVI